MRCFMGSEFWKELYVNYVMNTAAEELEDK